AKSAAVSHERRSRLRGPPRRRGEVVAAGRAGTVGRDQPTVLVDHEAAAAQHHLATTGLLDELRCRHAVDDRDHAPAPALRAGDHALLSAAGPPDVLRSPPPTTDIRRAGAAYARPLSVVAGTRRSIAM